MKKFAALNLSVILMSVVLLAPPSYAYHNDNHPQPSACTPAHVTTDGWPYLVADNLVLVVAAEGYITQNSRSFAHEVAKHAGMTQQEIVANVLNTLSMTDIGKFEATSRIYKTPQIVAETLANYSSEEIVAEENRQLEMYRNKSPYNHIQWEQQLQEAASCNDSERIAYLLAISRSQKCDAFPPACVL